MIPALARDAILAGARLNGGRDRDLLELEVLNVLSTVLQLRSVELYGTRVMPMVRDMLG